MTARIAAFLGKTVVVAGLATGLALGSGPGEVAADQCTFFDRNPAPAGARTGGDPYDPYAPVDLGASLVTDGENLRAAGPETSGEEWAMPPLPTLPGRPY